jgi:hypothetical protein
MLLSHYVSFMYGLYLQIFPLLFIKYIVTCLTEGNDRIPDTAGNNCKLVYNRIRDTVAPFLVTVTIGPYGYESNNGMRGYVATGESALELRRRRSAVPAAGSKKPPVL